MHWKKNPRNFKTNMFIRSFKHLLLDLSVYAKSLLNGRTRKKYQKLLMFLFWYMYLEVKFSQVWRQEQKNFVFVNDIIDVCWLWKMYWLSNFFFTYGYVYMRDPYKLTIFRYFSSVQYRSDITSIAFGNNVQITHYT